MDQIDRTLNKRHTDIERIALYDAREKIIKLEGEANVLRSLLGKCVDVIDTIPGDSDDECSRLLGLKDTCIKALKVMP